MATRDPYQAPGADLAAPPIDAVDQTGPFSPAGRFGRLSYLAWGVLIGVLSQLAYFAVGGKALMTPAFDAAGSPAMPDIPAGVLLGLLALGLVSLVIGVIFMIRRLHDVNASGWFTLLGLVPLINLAFFLFLVFKGGTSGANRFGPERITPAWEKVVGFIGVALIVLMVIGMIAAILIPLLTQAT
jgi:uncharacterized membrane protein YhaH (DUF805 family)